MESFARLTPRGTILGFVVIEGKEYPRIEFLPSLGLDGRPEWTVGSSVGFSTDIKRFQAELDAVMKATELMEKTEVPASLALRMQALDAYAAQAQKLNMGY